MAISAEMLEFLKRTRFAKHLGVRLDSLDKGTARLPLEVKPDFTTSFGTTHGGSILSLLDITLSIAARSLFDWPRSIVTVDLSTSFIGTATGVPRDEGRALRAGQASIFCEGEARSDASDLVAKMIGTFRVWQPKYRAGANGVALGTSIVVAFEHSASAPDMRLPQRAHQPQRADRPMRHEPHDLISRFLDPPQHSYARNAGKCIHLAWKGVRTMTLAQLQWMAAALAFVAFPVVALLLIVFAARGRLLRCPEAGSVALVEVEQGAHGEPRGAGVRQCDLWPQRHACAQGCLRRFAETSPGYRVRLEALRHFEHP